MAALAGKARTRPRPTRPTGIKQKTNFSKNGSDDGLNTESSQKLLFYLLEKIDKLDHKLDEKVDKLNDKIDSRFLWTIGIMFTGFIGIITIILSRY